MRQCSTCKKQKPPSAFWKGKRQQCKQCEMVVWKRWYEQAGGRDIVRKNTKLHRQRTGYPGWSDPLKKHIRNLTQAAIRRGRLVRHPCESCGSASHVHAHHHDYRKPFEVRWLCDPCHKAEHKAIRAAT